MFALLKWIASQCAPCLGVRSAQLRPIVITIGTAAVLGFAIFGLFAWALHGFGFFVSGTPQPGPNASSGSLGWAEPFSSAALVWIARLFPIAFVLAGVLVVASVIWHAVSFVFTRNALALGWDLSVDVCLAALLLVLYEMNTGHVVAVGFFGAIACGAAVSARQFGESCASRSVSKLKT
jgi:hypothetical protein